MSIGLALQTEAAEKVLARGLVEAVLRTVLRNLVTTLCRAIVARLSLALRGAGNPQCSLHQR